MDVIERENAVASPALTGSRPTEIGVDAITELEGILAASGLGWVSLKRRYSVVFVYPGIGIGKLYPELAGCTKEVCTFAEQTSEFDRHGLQLIGLSTRSMPAGGDVPHPLPFPVGVLPTSVATPLLEFSDRDGERYARRTSFVTFPDGTGLKFTEIADPAAHVRECFDLALAHRLRRYERDVCANLAEPRSPLQPSLQHRAFLANGADSRSISAMELEVRVVAKLADPAIVAQEGHYIARINRLLEDASHPRIFPRVYAVCDSEQPGYYLMEAADPVTLDRVLFHDEAMTTLRRDRLPLLERAMEKLANLYSVSWRPEEPAVARYHLFHRFLAIPKREDFRRTYEALFAGARPVEEILATPVVIDGTYHCRSYVEQMAFLGDNIERFVQPIGAYLHGDVHLKNMLVGRDGSDMLFVDPRVVWDGHEVGDPGFGDPLYDYGTLLHSLHTMSAILHAIDAGRASDLLQFANATDRSGSHLAVSAGSLRLTNTATVDWFVDWVRRTVPGRLLGAHWQARLHLNTANALVGWLKHARALQSSHAWMAVLVSALFHLEGARRLMEERKRIRP